MTTRDGRFELHLSTTAVDGALIETAVREAKDALFTAGNQDATLADGLVEMANRSLCAVASGNRKEHYRVLLHLDTDGQGWVSKKGAIPLHLLQEFTCDGTLIPVWETDGLPVSVGRAQRIVPLRTRRLVEDRDRGCRYPGCPVTGFLENHHIQHWSKGGATNRDTVVSLCPTHHRQHHQGRFLINGNPDIPDGLVFPSQYGQRIGPNATATAQAAATSDADRTDEGRVKTGVFTGFFGINPVNGAKVPVFVADYVLMGYGTGAIMAVPAHDERDYAFATKYDIDIIQTIGPADDPHGVDLSAQAYTGDGVVVNSAQGDLDINGMGKDEAKATMIGWLEAKGVGRGAVTYRLRDWLFSRQRYWGEPFPIVWDEDGGVHALPESMLPVELPEVTDYSPRSYDPDDADSSPEPPLGKATEWVEVELDLGDGPRTYYRETNTMPQWAGSCWYEMRYIDPTDDKALVDPANEAYWMGPRPQAGNISGGTDLYVGGVEHAVLHLLYARFWHKVLFDLGHVSSSEPYHRLFNQGYVQAYAYTDARGQYVPADEVEEVTAEDGTTSYLWQGQPVRREYGKMGKSLKNIVTPDDMYEAYGADTFRVYEMSMGPLDADRPWDTRAVAGSQRFLQRLWRNVIDETTGELTVTEESADEETRRLVAKTIVGVREDYEGMRLNTAIAKLIVLNNHLTGLGAVPREAVEALVLMTAPVAPHIAEEIWKRLGHEQSLAHEDFPVVTDEALLAAEKVTCVIQVKGKVRDRLEVDPDISEAELEKLALAAPGVIRTLDGRGVRKVIVRAPKLVSIVPE